MNWFNSLSSTNATRINKVLLDDDDNILACGNFYLSVTPPGLNQYFAYGGSDWFIGKFNGANGNCLWFNSFGSSSVFPETANDLFLLNNTDLFVTGNFRETADFDPSDVNVINYTANNVNEPDAFSCKYNYVTCPAVTSAINPTSCGPYTSPSGNTYTTTGNYTNTLSAASGCDSIIFIGLIVNNGATGPTTTATACDVYYWAPTLQYFYNSGSYSYDFPMFNGCDSTIYLDLTINYSPTVNISNNSGQLNVVGSTGGLTYQWYDCFNNQPVPGATSSTFTPLVSGSYYVVGTTGAGCSESSLCEFVTVTGVSDLTESPMQIFPNPSNGWITLRLVSADFTEVEVLNVLGEKVSSFSFTSLEKQFELPKEKGIYLLRIIQMNNESIRKVIRN